MGAGDKEVTWVDRSVRNADGELETVSVQRPSDGNVPGLVGERSYRCVKCGFAYKESDVQMFRGKPYCVPMGCYKDIQSILFEENCSRIRARTRGREAERVQHFSES